MEGMKLSAEIFREMENQITRLLKNCVVVRDLRRIHARVVMLSLSSSNFLATQIINICNSCGEFRYGALVFNQLEHPNVFSFNAMIRACTQHCRYAGSVELFIQMLRGGSCGEETRLSADEFTYPFVLKACGGLIHLDLGKQAHVHVFKSGLGSLSIIQNSIIELYAKCDDLESAHKVFDELTVRDVISWNTLVTANMRAGRLRIARYLFDTMPEKTLVSWTAMISGYSAAGRYVDAMEAFRRMQMSRFDPDDVTIVSMLPACAESGALELGEWIHLYTERRGLAQKLHVRNALMEMYMKCGCTDRAMQLFRGMPERDVISWSTIISGLAVNGQAREAVLLFAEMEAEGGVKPNAVTFLGLLSACSHTGLLEEGLKHLTSMVEEYGIVPSVEHYGILVDLLGRSNCIPHAVEVIKRMPMKPDATVWGSLLGACRMHGNVETAILAMEKLLELEPEDTGNYVLLSNIYAAAGRWAEVARMRKAVRTRSMNKVPGCSSIEANNSVREFVAEDVASNTEHGLAVVLEILGIHLSDDRVSNLKEPKEEEILNSIESYLEPG